MVTIKDIAKLANVSIGTVDRVIHDRGGVSLKTKENIARILKEHNFKVNVIARSLAMKKKFNLAVLIPEFDEANLFWKSPFMGISKAAEEVVSFGIQLQTFKFNPLDHQSYLNQFKKLVQTKPDAVIFAPFFLKETKQMVQKLENNSVPYLFLNIDVEGFNNISFIGQDSYNAGYLAGKLMYLSTGKNATILIPQIDVKFFENSLIEKRIKGFHDYFSDQNIPIQTILLHFDNLKNVELVQKKLYEVLDATKKINGIWIPSSRISTIVNCIATEKLNQLKLIGFDTTEQNIECLKNDKVLFLISQKSFNQGFQAVKVMTDYLIQNIIPQSKIFSPLEIITKENLEFSQRNKWQYHTEKG
jgi:LacI family transcriptional regulator